MWKFLLMITCDETIDVADIISTDSIHKEKQNIK